MGLALGMVSGVLRASKMFASRNALGRSFSTTSALAQSKTDRVNNLSTNSNRISQVQGSGEAQRGVGASEDIGTPCCPQRKHS